MELNFVKDLNESTMFRSRQMAETTDARGMIDFAFMNLVTLHMLYSDYKTAPEAQQYAAKTIQYRGFDNYHQSSTDLYVALNAIKTGKLAGGVNAATQLSKLNLPEAKIKQYLTLMSQGQPVPNPATYLMSFERGMDIQDASYKALRRMSANWTSIDDMQRKTAATRMLQFYRTKAIRSELYGTFSKFAKENNLELHGVANAEKPAKSIARNLAIAATTAVAGFAAGREFGKWLVK